MRAMGVIALVLAMASTAMAWPANSTVGAKRLQRDNVHNVGVGYPSTFYEWWNRGPRKLDWALKGALVYGDWPVAYGGGRFIRIGAGLSAPLRWHLSNKRRSSSDPASSSQMAAPTWSLPGASGPAPRSGASGASSVAASGFTSASFWGVAPK